MMGLSGYSTEHSVGAYDIYIMWYKRADTSSVRTSKRATRLDMMYAIKKKTRYQHFVCAPLQGFVSIFRLYHYNSYSF